MICGDEIVGSMLFHACDRIWAAFDWDENENRTFRAVVDRGRHNRLYRHPISLIRPAIVNRYAPKGPQMCHGSLGEGRKEARKIEE
jgi:hypothetical protein